MIAITLNIIVFQISAALVSSLSSHPYRGIKPASTVGTFITNGNRSHNLSLCLHMTKRDQMRRQAISRILFTATGLSSNTLFPSPAAAKDELFKPNPLTNGFLEKIRILEQAEADNLQYNGELAPGSRPENAAYAKMLVPILVIGQDIEEVNELIHMSDGQGLEEAEKILSKAAFEKKNFKRIFNAFADNIYYSDPDRANLYLGGGATPRSEQSIAYLLRNDILTNVENLQAEVNYLIKERKAGNQLEIEDLYLYAKTAKDGMKKYLDLVPPSELTSAEKILSSN